MSDKQPADRKPYTPPTVIRHGSATEKTRSNVLGNRAEIWGWKRYNDP